MLQNRYQNNKIDIDSENGDIRSILFRNFTGKPDNFNPKGTMGNFTVVLSDEKADELEAQGLNVKRRENRDGDSEARLQIFVRFENFPPKVYRVVDGTIVELDKDSIEVLDTDDIQEASLVISPYSYDFNGRKGVKAYLSKGYFTIADDHYAKRYKGADTDGDAPF